MKTRQMMLTAAMSALSVATLTFASCANETSLGENPEQVTINFSTRAMSDVNTRSEASAAENAITKVALFGLDGSGVLVQSFPVVENPGSAGVTLSISPTVSTLRAIANPTEIHSLDYSNATELDAEIVDLNIAPESPFVMGGTASVSGSSVISLELVRSIAKIEVEGADGFEVTSVAAINTRPSGYVFPQSEIPLLDDAYYIAYPEVEGSVVYVGENSDDSTPLSLRVRGTFKGVETAYTFPVTRYGESIDIVRNTAYLVKITPLSDSECEIDVTIPEWEDVIADEGHVIDFGNYYSVDFHNHTGFTDGSHPLEFVLSQGMKYGLDIIVNSEHGGSGSGNATIGGNNEIGVPTWNESGIFGSAILGDEVSGGRNMWRWQSVRDYSYPFIARFNEVNATTILSIQGLEWNPPGHEHSSAAVITGQFDGGNNASAMAQFEYMFDNNDSDKTGGAEQGWVKSTLSGHAKSMEAAEWLQKNHRYTSYLVPAHPERQNRWTVADYRDLNDVAPDVFVAFESIPGHQSSSSRGSYGDGAYGGRTHGGAGVQSGVIGNVWDAMLSEGRRFWLVANSDFHSLGGDYYPGQYQKTYIAMKERTAQGFVDGLRSGNLYTVHGDIIDRLEFSAGNATMGQTYTTDGNSVKVRILVRDPETNNNNVYTSLTNPSLDHIDLIAGKMRDKVEKGTSEYSNGEYADVKVIARFDSKGGVKDAAGITSTKWEDLGGGLKLVEYTVAIEGDTYFRLRGTNHGLGVVGETDANGNPEVDVNGNSLEKAFEDLWFYSSPVFVRVR
jgi:hypothetical protein